MKTLKALILLSLGLVFLGASAFNPRVSDSSSLLPPQGVIKYQVSLYVEQQFITLPGVHFFIILTDEHGRRIGLQQIRPGFQTYFFSEVGPVSGTRIAWLVEGHMDQSFMTFTCAPDVRSGLFLNNLIYNFNLFPQRGESE